MESLSQLSISICTRDRWSEVQMTLEKLREIGFDQCCLLLGDDASSEVCPIDLSGWRASQHCGQFAQNRVSGRVTSEVTPESISEAFIGLVNSRDLLFTLKSNARVPDMCHPDGLATALYRCGQCCHELTNPDERSQLGA